MAFNHYTELRVWQKSNDLAFAAYQLSDSFPKREWYGLTAQLRRAALSVQLNISEGHGRATPGEFLHALSVARGSLNEVDNILRFSERLGYATEAELVSLYNMIADAGRMLVRLQQRVRTQRTRKAAIRRIH
jgi:four helix bundle protein